MHYLLYAILWLTVPSIAMPNVNEAGKTFFGDLAGTFLKALFPEIRKHPHTANDVPVPGKAGTFGPGSGVVSSNPSGYPHPGYDGVRPTIPFTNSNSANHGFFSQTNSLAPYSAQQPPTAGLSVGGLPIFNHPTHNAFKMGYNGRTDLPSNYVYPFARKGTKVMPDHANASPFLLAPSNPQPTEPQAANLISRQTAEQYGFGWGGAQPNDQVVQQDLRQYGTPQQQHTQETNAFIQDMTQETIDTKVKPALNRELITETPRDEVYDSFNFDYDALSEFDKSLKLGDLLSSNVSEISPLFIHAFLQAKAESELQNYFGKQLSKKTNSVEENLPVLPVTTEVPTTARTTTTTTLAPRTAVPTTAIPITSEELEHRIDRYLRKTLTRETDEHDHDRELPVLHEFIDLRKESQPQDQVTNHKHSHHENIVHDPFPRAFRYRILDDPSLRRFMDKDETCSECISADLNFIKGSWTQIYGDIEALKTTYSNLASLRDVSFISSNKEPPFSHNLRPINPTCVGLHIKEPSDLFPLNRESEMALFFRDGRREEYHELTGYAKEEQEGGFKFELPHFTMPMCLMKAGPIKNALGDYLVMTDTKGPNKCKSFHVFVRNARAFARLHAREVIDYLRKRITVSNAHDLMSLPHPQLCQASET